MKKVNSVRAYVALILAAATLLGMTACSSGVNSVKSLSAESSVSPRTASTAPTSLGLFSILNEGAAQGNSMTVGYGVSSEGDQLVTYWNIGSNIMNVLSLGNSQYEIVETLGNRCMTADGAAVSITTCTGAADQLFALNLQADGSYVIQSTAGSCIAAPSSFATVVAQACNSSLDQNWNFTGATALNPGTSAPPTPTTGAPPPTGTTATPTSLGLFSILNEGAAQGNSMTVGYGVSSEGDQLVTYWNTGSNIMNVLSLGNSQYEIVETLGNRCMTADEAAVSITTCTGAADQLFALNLQADGSYVIQSTAGSCIAAPSSFATVVAQTCNSSLDQNWNFTGATALNLGTGTSITNSPTVPAGYHLTFDDEFQSLSISDTNGAGTNWYTHTVQCCMYDTSNPSTPTYMAGITDGPGEDPYSLIPGQGLDIRLQKTNGAWYSGVLATVDGTGSGFSQQYGYFEMKANFPAGLGTWPAFWFLNSAHLSQGAPAGEIDLVEAYMQFPTIVTTTLHDWSNSTTVGFNQATVANLSNGFHTYGMLWTASTMTFYFDGAAIWQTPTPAIMNQPYYPIIDLGLGGGWPTNQTPQQSDMIVQYVRAYSN